jgi:hypothetical protein
LQINDQRKTIYWNPDIITDAQGKTTFEYLNAAGKVGIPLKLTRRSGAIWQCVPLIFDQGVPGGLTRYSGAN